MLPHGYKFGFDSLTCLGGYVHGRVEAISKLKDGLAVCGLDSAGPIRTDLPCMSMVGGSDLEPPSAYCLLSLIDGLVEGVQTSTCDIGRCACVAWLCRKGAINIYRAIQWPPPRSLPSLRTL